MTLNFEAMEDMKKAKMVSEDRILVLQAMDGGVKATTGLVDTRLFKGGNRLHAIIDPTNCMWSLKYEMGGLPDPLKTKFTSFKFLLEYCRAYFKKRNLDIVEVQD